MKKLVNEELNKMKYLLGYQRGMVISEQGTVLPTNDPLSGLPIQSRTINLNQATTDTKTQVQPAATVKDVIKQIQRILVDKYKVNLGTTGDLKDGVDGDWGNLTQSALEKVVALKKARKEQSQQSVPDATKNVMPSTEITPGGQYGGAPTAATITTAPSAASAAAPVAATPAAATPAAATPAAATPAAATTPATAESPSDLYTRLVKNNLLVGRLNGKKAVYKGPDLSQEDNQKLQSYLSQQGYRLSTFNNDYETASDKLVFRRD
jgi:hypothetical protein